MIMDMNKIFNLFSGGDDLQPYTSKELEDIKKFEEFKETPMFKLGMFKKIIFNHISYKKKIVELFKSVKPQLDIEELEETGELVAFERGWDFISQCEIDKEDWEMGLILCNDEEFRVALKLTIQFYQNLEEYEKCAHLKKTLDFLQKNLEKQN
tara:strand:- start:22101 stop:22559 length:459 start_codon:yes stop_codon:yes gene_type:complete